ncbi:MAG: hypothetical protein HY682_03120 [Chloroflexi bacterium]|nr:hypothetical protein [Chloroflexota bacterium]
MRRLYVAPELLHYGSVSGLTSEGFVKCTPFPDDGGFGHSHAGPEGVVLDPDEHSDNCTQPGQLSP